MPDWLCRYLNSKDLRTHFWRALAIALVLRVLCAYFVYGPQALDDYKHGVWPAYQYFAGLPLDDFPNYRSHLLVWFLSGFVSMASWFNVTSALGQARAMYLGLGMTSLLGMIGTYQFARTQISQAGARLMLYFVAMYPLMPFVSTRAFGEAVALSFVLFGFGWLEFTRQQRATSTWRWLIGFLSLGAATLFRFHAGLLFVAYLGVLVVLRAWRGVLAGLIAGVLTLAAQTGIDWASGKTALETLFVYLKENEGGGKNYGVSPWYTTWLFVIAVAFLPFSFMLFRHGKEVWRKLWPVLVPALVFILAHTFAAHKEERFLYPILGLELWALAALWAASAADNWARRFFAPIFLGFSGVLLLVVCFVNSQEGEIEPPAYAQSHYDRIVYLDNDSLFGLSRFQFYFLRPPSVLVKVRPDEFNISRIDAEFSGPVKPAAVVLLTSDPAARDQLRALEGVGSEDGRCQNLREAGSLVDRLLYKMNPRHNQRRRPTWYLVCERSSPHV